MQSKRTIIVLDDSDDEVQQVLDTAPVAPRGCKKQKTDPKTSTSSSASHVAASSPAAAATSIASSRPNPAFPMRSFRVTIEAMNRFKTFFPDRATTALAAQYHAELLSVMHAYQTSSPLHLQHRYVVMQATANGTSADFTHSAVSAPTPSKCFANALLLELFPTLNPSVKRGAEKPTYLWLTTKAGIKNPKFVQLHAVRYHEVGCGLDEDGCLSMCFMDLKGGERFTRAMYVVREEVKGEAEPEGVRTELVKTEDERGEVGHNEGVNVEGIAEGVDEDLDSLFVPE